MSDQYVLNGTLALALAASATTTIAEIATPAIERVRIKAVSLSMSGATLTTPVTASIRRAAAGMTGSPTTVVPTPKDAAAPASQCTCKQWASGAVIQTYGATLGTFYQQQVGERMIFLPLADEYVVGISTWLCLVVVTPAAVTPTVSYEIHFEE